MIELSCDSAIFAADEISREERLDDVGGEIVEVANGGGYDHEFASGYWVVNCFGVDKAEGDVLV